MKVKYLVSAVFAVLAFAVAGLAADGGEATYKAKCVMCHGADGVGATPAGKAMGVKDLATPEIQSKTDAQLIEVVTNGKGKMPAYKAQLNETQIAEVVKYLRTFKKK